MYNNKRNKIIRENQKGIYAILDVAILAESVIFTCSVKGIKHHSIKRGMFGNELLRMCCVFFQNEKILDILMLIILFNAITNGTLLPPTSLTLQEIHLVRCLTYISHRYFAPGRILVISSPTTEMCKRN